MGRWFERVKISNVSMLVFLTSINLMIYIDRGVLASILTTLENPDDGTNQAGLGLTEVQGGALGSIFMLGYMIAGPIFAYYAQTIQPLFLIAIGLSVWGLSSLTAGLSVTFWQLMLSRAFSGVGEASFVCLAPPFILDHAPAARKTTWVAIFYSAIAFGYAIGYIAGNQANIQLGGWYWPFRLQSIVAIPFIILCIIAKKNPNMLSARKSKNGEEVQVISVVQQLEELGGNLIYIFIVLGFSAFVFTIGGLSYWTPTIIEKYYGQSKDVANNTLGLITLFCGIVGTLVGSVFLDFLVRKKLGKSEDHDLLRDTYTEFSCLFLTITIFIGCVGAFVGIFINTFYSYIIGVGFGEFFIFLSKGPVAMALMNSVPDDLRGQANAVCVFFMHLLGDFPSPYVIGWFFELYGYYSGIVLIYGWLLWAVLTWGIAWNISVISN